VIKQQIIEYLKTVKPVNSHSHHLSAAEHVGMTLPGVLNNSYCRWMDTTPNTAAQAETYVLRNGCNTYVRWLRAGIEELYGLPFTAANFDELSRRVEQAHRDPSWPIRILEERCGYERILLDRYQRPGDDLGRRQLFEPVLRCNMFAVCVKPGEADHNGNDAFAFLGREFTDFDEYLLAIFEYMKPFKAIKFAVAYDGDNDIRRFDHSKAQAAFREPSAASPYRKDYYDYMIFRLCEMAGELGIPVQIHTGLGRMDKSAPLYLRELIAALPGVKFDLFHGGFPWTDDTLALLHNFPNTWADLCWLPLVNTSVARRFVREALDVCGAHRMLWGCDTWTSEESYGALLAGREVIASALADLCAEGAIDETYALYLAKRIWRDNGMELYGL